MVVHLIPAIFNPYIDVKFRLIDINIPQLNLTLKEGVEVVVGKPYPNKTIHVVCRKKGQKAINGLLVEVPDGVAKFTMIVRWALDADVVAEHIVNFELVDRDFEMATQDPGMWRATQDGTQKDRWPCEFKTPCNFIPRFEVLFEGHQTLKEGDFCDCFSKGYLVKREENYLLPTIKRSHLYGRYNMHLYRMPVLDDVFGQMEQVNDR